METLFLRLGLRVQNFLFGIRMCFFGLTQNRFARNLVQVTYVHDHVPHKSVNHLRVRGGGQVCTSESSGCAVW